MDATKAPNHETRALSGLPRHILKADTHKSFDAECASPAVEGAGEAQLSDAGFLGLSAAIGGYSEAIIRSGQRISMSAAAPLPCPAASKMPAQAAFTMHIFYGASLFKTHSWKSTEDPETGINAEPIATTYYST